MTDPDDELDDATIAVDRASLTASSSASDPAVEPEEDEEDLDLTVAVKRAVPATPAAAGDGGTDEDDRTIVVDRTAPGADDEDDHTILVDRTAPGTDDEDDHTVVVDGQATGAAKPRAALDEDRDDTIAVTRGSSVATPPEGDDATVIVERGAASRRLARPETGRRRGIKPPPVPEGFAPLPTEGLGPWGVEEYQARSITPPPHIVEVDADPTPPRPIDPDLRSVRKHARRVARRALVAFAISCVVLVAAMALALSWLLR